MSRLTRILVLPLWLSVLAPLVASGNPDAAPIEGAVLEVGTQKPIPHAIVVARWTEGRSISIADSQTVCMHVESAVTDAAGRFTLPRYKGKPPTYLDSYARGYVRSDAYYRTGAYLRQQDLLKPFTGTREERFDYLWRLFSATSCNGAGRSERNLYHLYESAYYEARPLAETSAQKEKLESMRWLAAYAGIAEDRMMTTEEANKLIEVYLRSHLQ